MLNPHQSLAFAISSSVIALVTLLGFPQSARAANVMAVTGSVHIQRGETRLPVEVGVRLREGDVVKSADGGEVVVKFDDGARLALRQDSTLSLEKLPSQGASTKGQKTIKMLKGGLRYISGKATVHQRVLFITETAAVGIRGTDIEIVFSSSSLDEETTGTYLKVNTGDAYLQALDGTQVDAGPGQVAFGGEPDLVPRGAGGTKRPAGRLIKAAANLFKTGSLDQLMGSNNN
jgi:hypothetical protein